ncbi:MAG: PPOX class F420-dependent oxidoreductase [Frankiaceae bacterium]
MDADDARTFLQSNHHAVIATRRTDGSPHLSPVTVAVDDAGRVIISSTERTVKVRNLRREPRASVCVFTNAFFGDWVQLDGPVEIVDQPEAMELLVDYYRRVSGEHPDWDDYRAAMRRDQRVLVRLTIERAGPSASR